MRTAEEYLEKLRSMRPNVHMNGEIVRRDDERLMPEVNVIMETFKLVENPDYKDLLVTTSHLTGEKINRFCHIHQNADDLLAKQKMTRKLCNQVGGCILRCMGIDAMNALSIVTKDIDDARGTEYHQRFLNYLKTFQDEDLVANCAQTDVKGDRKRRPHEQRDPDLYLRVVEKRADGIVVRGAKAHNTVGPHCDEIIVVPTRALTKEESDWAVAFAIPADTEGVHQIIRANAPRRRERLQAPFATYGTVDSFTVFDDVFVPWERVFMCGETEFAGQLALAFATYHRHSYTGCKPGITDILLGAAAVIADYNGISKEQHVRGKLAELITCAELVYAAGMASAMTSSITASGTCFPNIVYCNVGRHHAGVNVYREHEILADLAGGLPATIPPERDWFDPVTGPFLHKYVMRVPSVSAENQHRAFRMISDLLCSAHAGVFQVAGVHGGGSPIMEEIAIMAQYDLEQQKNLFKYLAGINEES